MASERKNSIKISNLMVCVCMSCAGAIHEVVPLSSAVATSPMSSGVSESISWQEEEGEFVQALASQDD